MIYLTSSDLQFNFVFLINLFAYLKGHEFSPIYYLQSSMLAFQVMIILNVYYTFFLN